jgi:hypothetical protein
MVTHDPRFTRYSERIVHLFDGRIVAAPLDSAEAVAKDSAHAPTVAGALRPQGPEVHRHVP